MELSEKLACPYCKSEEVELIGVAPIGKHIIQGGVPVISGRVELGDHHHPEDGI